jgi:hypothetical protein
MELIKFSLPSTARVCEILIYSSIFFHYLSNLYSKCFKNGFLLKFLANTDFVYVKDIADSSEDSKKLKNCQTFLGFFRSKFEFRENNE